MSDVTSVPAVAGEAAGPPVAEPKPARPGILSALEDQLALRPLLREYFIPVETNNIWYVLGGVLALSLTLEIVTGFVLALLYVPDAARAYDITKSLIQGPWAIVINLHYWNAFLIFGLVMAHMMRVFITGGYRRGKQALWQVGVGLAAATFILSLTGESLHWDEVGFAVPWNVGEVLQAIGLAGAFNYATDGLTNVATATEKLGQMYAIHIALVPILLLLLIGMHYYLVKVKGISMPFWARASGRTSPFSSHVRAWLVYGGIALGVILLIAVFVRRDPGVAPQYLPASPLFGQDNDPGGFGFKPSFPISWTQGMNITVAGFGVDPDIWGAMIGMALLLVALVSVPFLDRGDHEPNDWRAAFNLRKRGLAFAAMAIFWLILIVGVIQSALATAG